MSSALTEKEKAGGGRLPLAVVIVNYRTPDLAIAAARSVRSELVRIGGAVVIVDNASGDGSADALKAFADSEADVRLIAAASNGGFAAGNNLGFEAIDADYYLLLNSDAFAEPGAVQAILSVAHADPDTGIVTPRILNSIGAAEVSRFRRHSPLSEFVDGAASGPITRRLASREVAIAADDWAAAPDWVSFAAVLISRAAIDAAGPMDEEYFLYYEDCDYCDRVMRAGFSTALAPEAIFRHDAGGSTGIREKAERRERLPAYYYRARNRYFRKFFGPAGPVTANLFWYAGRLVARVRGLVGRPAPGVPEARAGDLWIGWRG